MNRKRFMDADLLDEDFDAVFFQDNHELKRKRSSILKQAKLPGLDICEDDFDGRYGRKSTNPKRVSFADTFQVKELNGNIYDIPGRNALESSKECSLSIQLPNLSPYIEKENFDPKCLEIAMSGALKSISQNIAAKQIVLQREIVAEDMSLSESIIMTGDLPLNSTTLPTGFNKQFDLYGEQDMNTTILPGNNFTNFELRDGNEEEQYPTCAIVTSVSCMTPALDFTCKPSNSTKISEFDIEKENMCSQYQRKNTLHFSSQSMDFTCQPPGLDKSSKTSERDKENIYIKNSESNVRHFTSSAMNFTCLPSVTSDLKSLPIDLEEENVQSEQTQTNTSDVMDGTWESHSQQLEVNYQTAESECIKNKQPTGNPILSQTSQNRESAINEPSIRNSILHSFEMNDNSFLDSMCILPSQTKPACREKNDQDFISQSKDMRNISKNNLVTCAEDKMLEDGSMVKGGNSSELERRRSEDKVNEIICHEQILNKAKKTLTLNQELKSFIESTSTSKMHSRADMSLGQNILTAIDKNNQKSISYVCEEESSPICISEDPVAECQVAATPNACATDASLESPSSEMLNLVAESNKDSRGKEMSINKQETSAFLKSLIANKEDVTDAASNLISRKKETEFDALNPAAVFDSSARYVTDAESIIISQKRETDLDTPNPAAIFESSTRNMNNATDAESMIISQKGEMDIDTPIPAAIFESSARNMKNLVAESNKDSQEEEMPINKQKTSAFFESLIANREDNTVQENIHEKKTDFDNLHTPAMFESSTRSIRDAVSEVEVVQSSPETVKEDVPEVLLSCESSLACLNGATSEHNLEQSWQAKLVFSPDALEKNSLRENMLLSASFKILHSETTSIAADSDSNQGPQQLSSILPRSKIPDESIITEFSVKTSTNITTEMRLEMKSQDKNESHHVDVHSSLKSENLILPSENLEPEPSNTTVEFESEKIASPEKLVAKLSTNKEFVNISHYNSPKASGNESCSSHPADSTATNKNTSKPEDEELTIKDFENILKESSEGEECKWKLKSIEKNKAVFVLSWGCRMSWIKYTCTVYLHIQQMSPNESSIELLQGNDDDFVDSITELGYRAFFHLIREKNMMHPICSNKTLLKLSEYSAVALKVEALMRDFLKLFFSRYTYEISDSVDPLRIDIDVENDERESSSVVTCLIDLNSYPDVKIVPEVKHLYVNDITEEIRQAIALVEPGKNYIFNIAKAANGI